MIAWSTITLLSLKNNSKSFFSPLFEEQGHLSESSLWTHLVGLVIKGFSGPLSPGEGVVYIPSRPPPTSVTKIYWVLDQNTGDTGQICLFFRGSHILITFLMDYLRASVLVNHILHPETNQPVFAEVFRHLTLTTTEWCLTRLHQTVYQQFYYEYNEGNDR